MHKLAEVAGEEAAKGRVIVAHLGNGASRAAVRGGKCVDTTMGLTPAGGLMMGTRCGDLDPGVLLYLLREKGLSVAALDDLVNQRLGLLGVSGSSSDMQDLLRRESDDRHASEAIELFCRQAKKYLGGWRPSWAASTRWFSPPGSAPGRRKSAGAFARGWNS